MTVRNIASICNMVSARGRGGAVRQACWGRRRGLLEGSGRGGRREAEQAAPGSGRGPADRPGGGSGGTDGSGAGAGKRTLKKEP